MQCSARRLSRLKHGMLHQRKPATGFPAWALHIPSKHGPLRAKLLFTAIVSSSPSGGGSPAFGKTKRRRGDSKSP